MPLVAIAAYIACAPFILFLLDCAGLDRLVIVFPPPQNVRSWKARVHIFLLTVSFRVVFKVFRAWHWVFFIIGVQ